MFGLSSLELRLAGYGVLLAAISAWLLWHDHQIEASVEGQQKAAVEAQKAEDAKVSAGVINDLNQRLASALQPVPVPVVRLCSAPGSVRASSPTAGTQSAVASPSGTSPGGMPAGNPGIDIGQQLSDLEQASKVIADYRDTTWEWAIKQGVTK